METEWHKIISFNGSQANAFEELICQLAANELNSDFALFERVGTPDGGVECYWKLRDGSEYGWQAKYYSDIKSSEWSNIKKSLFDAVQTHSKLSSYFICLPHNLSDGRRGRKTQKDVWDAYRLQWTEELKEKGREVNLILWNSSTIISKLIQPINSGIKTYFFNEVEIKTEQLFLHLHAAIDNLGPKYSQSLNFKLDYLPSVVDALTRSSGFRISFEKQLDKLIIELKEIINDFIRNPNIDPHIEVLQTGVRNLSDIFVKSDFAPSSMIPVAEYEAEIALIRQSIDSLVAICRENAVLIENKQTEPQQKDNPSNSVSGKADSERRKIREMYEFMDKIEGFIEFLNGPPVRAANEGLLFLSGPPGSGKSHFLADTAIEREKEGIPSILLLGEHFTNQPPKLFLQQILNPSGTLEDYLKSLETLARSKQSRILFIIDAINEGVGIHIWRNTIAGLVKELSQFKWIAFIFSYRSTYKDVIIPENFNPPHVLHAGFEGAEYEATKLFFEYYKIQQPRIPILNPEFSNPLFLKTFCLTLNKSGKTEIPEGYEGISAILNEYIAAVNKNIGIKLKYPYTKINLVSKAIDQLIRHQILTNNYIISWVAAYELAEPVLTGYTKEVGLLEEMIKEGLLIEDFHYDRVSGKYELHGIVFNYERFNDHLKAIYLLEGFKNVTAIKNAFSSKGKLRSHFFDKHGFTGLNSGLLDAFSIVIPERFGVELYEIFKANSEYAKRNIFESFLSSLVWRKHDTVKPESWEYVRKNLDREDYVLQFFNTILLLAGHSKNFYNGDFIHNLLKDKDIGHRDYLWSIRVADLWAWDKKNSVQRIIDWSWSEEEKSHISDDSLLLLGKVLGWLFTNPNRYIRDKATKAFASLFIDRLHLLKILVENFRAVNDPYVIERVLAGCYGAIIHSSYAQESIDFAQYIYDCFFKARKPPLNILTRDFGKCIIEYVQSKGGIIEYDKENLNPPFDFPFPNDIPDNDWVEFMRVKKEGKYTNEERGMVQIFASVLDFGDFSRYILGTNHGNSAPFSIYKIQSKVAYDELCKQLRGLKRDYFKIYTDATAMANGTSDLGKKIRTAFSDEESKKHIEHSEEMRDLAYSFLKSKLSDDQLILLEQSKDYIEYGFESDNYNKKRFDISIVQRYILKRVFEMGWTVDRFGRYDDSIDSYSRSASKSERVGKKYQWIAYHEIMALLSDNYFYTDRYYNEGDTYYPGPWKDYNRDIDPTVLIKYSPDEDDSEEVWRQRQISINWTENTETWLNRFDDLLFLKDTVIHRNADGLDWYLMYNFPVWKSGKVLGSERYKQLRREVWVHKNALLVNKNTKRILLNYVNSGKRLWLRDSSRTVREHHENFLGEFYFSEPYNQYSEEYYTKYPFSSFTLDQKKMNVIYTVEEYGFSSEYDLSENKAHIYKPAKFLNELIKGYSGKNDACVYNENGDIIAFDPGIFYNDKTSSFLVNKEVLDKALTNNNLELLWFFCGEKQIIGSSVSFVNRMTFSGFIYFEKGKLAIRYNHQQD